MHKNEMKVIDNNLIKSDINSFIAGKLLELGLFCFLSAIYGGLLVGAGIFCLVTELNEYFQDVEYVVRIVGVVFIGIVLAWLGYPMYIAIRKLIIVIKVFLSKINLTYTLKEDRLNCIHHSASVYEKPVGLRDLSDFFTKRRHRSRTQVAFDFIENGRATDCELRGYKFSEPNDMFYLLIVDKIIIGVYPQKIYRFED